MNYFQKVFVVSLLATFGQDVCAAQASANEAAARQNIHIAFSAQVAGKAVSPIRDQLVNGFEISAQEVRDVVAFLNSLTDKDFLQNPAFSDPNAKHPRNSSIHSQPQR